MMTGGSKKESSFKNGDDALACAMTSVSVALAIRDNPRAAQEHVTNFMNALDYVAPEKRKEILVQVATNVGVPFDHVASVTAAKAYVNSIVTDVIGQNPLKDDSDKNLKTGLTHLVKATLAFPETQLCAIASKTLLDLAKEKPDQEAMILGFIISKIEQTAHGPAMANADKKDMCAARCNQLRADARNRLKALSAASSQPKPVVCGK